VIARLNWVQWSIRTRLLLIAMLPVAYLFCSVILYSYHSRVKEANEELIERAKIVTKTLADGIEHDVISNDIAGLTWTINGAVQSDASIYRIDVLDAQKKELVHVSSLMAPKSDAPVYEAPITRTVIMVGIANEQSENSSVPVAQASKIGYVKVTMSATSLLQKKAHRFWFELLMSLVALLVSVWLALQLSESLTHPLRSITASLKTIGGGNYDTRVAIDAGGEIGELQASINQMAAALDEAKQHLERKVAERTEELLVSRNQALKADAEKRQLIQKVNSIVEDERKNIALEIHDQLNASLIAARLEAQRILQLVSVVSMSVDSQKELQEELQNKARSIIKITLDLYASGRGLVRRLRPEVLEMLGLDGAIQDMLKYLNNDSAECHFALDADGDFTHLSSELAISAYRIIQEAVSNIVKHATATNATISLRWNQDQSALNIVINDDGVGFDANAPVSGVGIAGMRERVYALGGDIEIESRAGMGATIRICLRTSS
jgi:two-component system, NarL family, sensor histidine kinase UhpB